MEQTMTIECVKLATNHMFAGNPIADQHRLRYKLIIQRQKWDLPHVEGMEYDQYDNPASIYLIWRDDNSEVRAVSRLYPTDRPFMLKEHFANTVTYREIPSGQHVLEGSRFCIDNSLDSKLRRQAANEIILAYLEYGLSVGITQIIGIMYPAYWTNLFSKYGWQPEWLGENFLTSEGTKSRPAILPVSADVLNRVRSAIGIHSSVINYGNDKGDVYVRAA
jgi:acyl homoserine lactone synthase